MERRDLLKGILGGLSSIALSYKVLSAQEMEEINKGNLAKVVEDAATSNPVAWRLMTTTSAEIYSHKPAVDDRIPNVYPKGADEGIEVSHKGNIVAQFYLDETVLRNTLVAVNNKARVVNYKPSGPPGDPSSYPIGRSLEYAEKGKSCWVLIRDKDGWVW
jgi:hypothetical protein